MKGQDGLRLQPHIDVSEGNPTWMPLNVKAWRQNKEKTKLPDLGMLSKYGKLNLSAKL